MQKVMVKLMAFPLHTEWIVITISEIIWKWNGREGGSVSATCADAGIGSAKRWQNAHVKIIYSISLAERGIAVFVHNTLNIKLKY
jgi:hypothetical protein